MSQDPYGGQQPGNQASQRPAGAPTTYAPLPSAAVIDGNVIGAIGGAIAFIGFLLPWFTIPATDLTNSISINGFGLLTGASLTSGGSSGASIFSISMVIVLVCALALVGLGLGGKFGSNPKRFSGLQLAASIVGLSLLGVFLLLLLAVSSTLNLTGSLFSVLGFGFWISLLSFIVGIVGASMTRSKKTA